MAGRICVTCGETFIRPGRATQCLNCKPSKTKEPRRPTETSHSKDVAYAADFVGGMLGMAGLAIMPLDKHDGAVIMRSSMVLPKQVAQVLEQDAALADKMVSVARKGALYYLALMVGGTVVLPILSHHGIGPKGMAMSDEAVNDTLQQVIQATVRATTAAARTAEDEAEQEAADDAAGVVVPDVDMSDLDMAFLNHPDAEVADIQPVFSEAV